MESELGQSGFLTGSFSSPQSHGYTNSFRSFREWRQQQYWTTKSWWRETTDHVILNSPWLKRETGHAFRLLWSLMHLLWWCFHYRALKAAEVSMLLCLAAVFVFLGMTFICYDRRESLWRTTVFSMGLSISSILQAGVYEDFREEHAIVVSMVILCHCNVHPICIFAVMVAGTCLNFADFLLRMRFFSWKEAFRLQTSLFLQVFELLLFAAFTSDFSARVKAVSSGYLFSATGGDAEEEMWKSPLAGRSGRRWCWLMALNSWFMWAGILVSQFKLEEKADIPDLASVLGRVLPLEICLAAPCVALASLLLLRGRWSVLVNDLVLCLCCCLPSALLTLETMLLEPMAGPWAPEIYKTLLKMKRELLSLCVLSSLLAMQSIIQAGCSPYICLLVSAFANSWVVALAVSYENKFRMRFEHAHAANPWLTCLIVWILVASHTIDFFKRMKGIREGIAQSLQNAASQSHLLNRGRGEGVNFIELPHLPGSERLPKIATSHLAVAVVRHAERADASSTFDEWCTSEDAAAFPWDPPITEKGFQQTRHLGEELAQRHTDFKVVISSPFLRCLQTAMVLADRFHADVLIDNELGEVMNTEIFETEPPFPPRPWSKVASTLKRDFDEDSRRRLKAGRFMGRAPKWPESSQGARLRYANRFLEYLRRARHTKKSCILVTHGHMVQACATILPATASRRVVSVDYAAVVLAVCQKLGSQRQSVSVDTNSSGDGAPALHHRPPQHHHSFTGTGHQSSSFHMPKHLRPEKEADQQSKLREGNELLQEAKLKYWDVWLQGVRTVSSSSGQRAEKVLQQVHQFQESLGRSWQDMVKLLGVLPPPEEFEDEIMGSESAPSIDCETTTSLQMYQDPAQTPHSPKSTKSSVSGNSGPVQKMSVKAFKEVELSRPSSSLAARRLRTRLELAPPVELVEAVESAEGPEETEEGKEIDERIFMTL